MRSNDRTTVVQGWIDRLLAGDDTAREALLGCTRRRLSLLARRMLRGFPGVGRWEETDDVLQNALVRLDRALTTVKPPSARDFFRLAATQIRRELIDLARRHAGPGSMAANHESWADESEDGLGLSANLADESGEPSRLADWTEFHDRVARLPEESREIFGLLWYQGLTHGEAAAILGVSEKTVSRRWIAARLTLRESLGGRLPGMGYEGRA